MIQQDKARCQQLMCSSLIIFVKEQLSGLLPRVETPDDYRSARLIWNKTAQQEEIPTLVMSKTDRCRTANGCTDKEFPHRLTGMICLV